MLIFSYKKILYFLGEKVKKNFSKFFIFFFVRGYSNLYLNNFFLYSSVPKNVSSKSKIRILFLEKGIFNDDIIDIFYEKKYELLQLNRKITKQLCNYCYNSKVNQHNYKSLSSKRLLHRNHLFFLKKLISNLKIDLFITFNFGSDEDAFVEALKEKKIPSVCLHKEGLMAKGEYNDFIKVLSNRYPFAGEKIIVYNKIIRDILIKHHKHKQSKIFIGGATRFDKMIKLKKSVEKKIFLFFLPGLHKSLPSQLGIDSNQSWKNLIYDFFKLIHQCSSNFKEYKIIIKSKYRDYELIKDDKEFLKLKDYVTIDHKSLAFDLIKKSEFCIGFNSMALIESFCCKKKVINCMFGEAHFQNYKKYIVDYKNLIKNVFSVDEALFEIKKSFEIKRRSEFTKFEKNVLNELIGNNLGNSTQKIRIELKKIISKNKGVK